MILDLDVGNSFIKWRLGDLEGQLRSEGLDRQRFQDCFPSQKPRRVRLATVACQQQQQAIEQWCQELWGVPVEIATTQVEAAGVVNSYADPLRMGVDRWLAMLAAFNQFNRPCCVVDCGSAITIDYVAADGRHQGGYIIPGLRLMRLGLLHNTQRVLASVDSAGVFPARPGESTEQAVDGGIALLFESLAQRVKADYRQLLGEDAQLVVTGGDGGYFIDVIDEGEYRPQLVLDGLAYALP
ncbi:MAG: type III pantothenate kinase [Motiliproteus sp.]|nr:type III pantothenate kinase [Motiliproteus sp.]